MAPLSPMCLSFPAVWRMDLRTLKRWPAPKKRLSCGWSQPANRVVLFRNQKGGGSLTPERANCPHKLTKAAERWLDGGAALDGSNCMASWRLHIAPSESHVSRGSHHAALRPAR